MFESLTEKLTTVTQRLSGQGRISEKDVDQALREVRLALLEADVNFRVARKFVSRVRKRAVGTEILRSITPGQQIVKIVHEEMTSILSGDNHRLETAPKTPTVIMLVGLQGSGKTTTAAKLALNLRKNGNETLLVAADLRRPAAIEQLESLGKQLTIPVYREDSPSAPVKVAHEGIKKAESLNIPWVILDTGGRLHIDTPMIKELQEIKEAVNPHETLLVLDSMTGQDAVLSSQEFHEQVGLTGIILTKLDGDARGGAALSVTEVTGIPIKYIGVGEKVNDLEQYHPDRLASRILGMGDVLSLVEKAQEEVNEEQAKELDKKMRTASFTLEDFLDQFQTVRRMGSLSQIMEMLPGFSQISKKLPKEALDEKQLVSAEAIIRSMTYQERRNPDIIGGSRRKRIANGSGTKPQDVNQLLNKFRQTQKLMKQVSQGKIPGGPLGFLG